MRWRTCAYCFDNPIRFEDPDGMRPGQHYKTQDAAAHAWGKEYGRMALSDLKGREWGSAIYQATTKRGKPYFSYNEGVQASEQTPNIIMKYPREIPEGANIVAFIHAHTNTENGNTDFSIEDRAFQAKNENRGLDFYLTTADGLLRVVRDDSPDGNTETLSNDMPRMGSLTEVTPIYFGGKWHSEATINTESWRGSHNTDDLLPFDDNGKPIKEDHGNKPPPRYYPPGYGPPGRSNGPNCIGCYENPPDWIKPKFN